MAASVRVCAALELPYIWALRSQEVLAPIIVNIDVMHLFLPSSGPEIFLAALVTVLDMFLAWSYRAAFRAPAACANEVGLVETRSIGRAA